MMSRVLSYGTNSVRRQAAAADPQTAGLAGEPNAHVSGGEFNVRLERELAALMSRQPKQSPQPLAVPRQPYDSETPLILNALTDEFDDGRAYFGDDGHEGCAQEVQQAVRPRFESSSPAVNRTKTRDRWLRSTRRNRRSTMFRKTASFAITLLVTAFIISIVAMILFGFPDGIKRLRTAGASNPTLAVGGVATVSETAPVRLRRVAAPVQGR